MKQIVEEVTEDVFGVEVENAAQKKLNIANGSRDNEYWDDDFSSPGTHGLLDPIDEDEDEEEEYYDSVFGY